MPFVKGQSGNPAGRKKADPDFVSAMRSRVPKAISTLDAVMNNPKSTGAEKTSASRVILEYAHGKPTQKQEIVVSADLASALERMRKLPNGG